MKKLMITYLMCLTAAMANGPSFKEQNAATFATGGGNGGSYNDADLFGEQENYSQVVSKIKRFFARYDKEMKEVFPEFSSKGLINVAKDVRLEVVDRELTDDDKVKGRTCLNYSQSNFIECDINKLKLISKNPKAQFVLMLHELLGLMRVEETSPRNAADIDGYSVSKRIAPYVTKVANFDLRIKKFSADDQKAFITQFVIDIINRADSYAAKFDNTNKHVKREMEKELSSFWTKTIFLPRCERSAEKCIRGKYQYYFDARSKWVKEQIGKFWGKRKHSFLFPKHIIKSINDWVSNINPDADMRDVGRIESSKFYYSYIDFRVFTFGIMEQVYWTNNNLSLSGTYLEQREVHRNLRDKSAPTIADEIIFQSQFYK